MTMTAVATGVFLLTALLAAVAQIWLKESAIQAHAGFWAEFLNRRVMAGYTLLTLSVLLSTWALRWLTFKWSVALGNSAYIFVLLLSRRRFGETLRPNQRWGALMILAGLIIFSL